MDVNNQIFLNGVCFSLLFSLCCLIRKLKSDNLMCNKVLKGNWTALHIRHIGGIIIILFTPLLNSSVSPWEMLNWPAGLSYFQQFSLLFFCVLLLIIAIHESKKETEKITEQVLWLPMQVLLHYIFRSGFLICYEWFFRGVLLFSCIASFGLIPAIAINIILYALIHSFNGRKEFLGSIPLGLIFCGFTIWWQTVWPAILMHLILSASYESMILNRLYSKRLKLVL